MKPIEAAGSADARFGVRLATVGLLLPDGVPAVFLESVAINPLPGAPGRVLGLMQMQGYPMLVLDARDPPNHEPTPLKLSVLVLGAPERGAGLQVDSPPQAVSVRATADAPPPVGCVFAPALISPMVDDLDSNQVWWHVDLPSLFRCLAGSQPSS